MRKHVDDKFFLNVSYTKMKRVKRIILEKLDGSFIDDFNKLEIYAQELRDTNPGSNVVINISKDVLVQGLDGTFLKGKFKGILLVALGQNSMKHFYPLAWAVIDRETARTWKWFIDLLRNSLGLADGEGLTLMSDMQKGLIDVVGQLFPKAHHRWCVRHIEANWVKIWKESFNKWILSARAKPIIKMLEDIRIKVMGRLKDLEAQGEKWTENFYPYAMELYNDFKIIAQGCHVQANGDLGYKVVEGIDRHVVSLASKKCTCRTWDLTGIPCAHAIKAF
ncbi:hypothetical protein P3L10_004598 [Capsicum annuum]